MDEHPGVRMSRLYRDVPPDLVARLQQFRARHPLRQAILAGTHWSYLDGGSGPEALLVLSGAACVAEMSWRSIEHFEQRHRVIAPDYPAVDTMAELVDGIAGLLDRENIARAHVFGGSYGGFVAQLFVRHHPNRTASLILSHTLLPDREMARSLAKLERWLSWLPTSLLRAALRLRLAKLFPKAASPEVALSKALFTEIVTGRLTRGQILSLTRRLVDLGLGTPFSVGDLSEWPGRQLLLMADDDPATPRPAREALVAMYPKAKVRMFSGSGHLTALLKQEEYFAAIDQFLGR